jgi:hypothetical protein
MKKQIIDRARFMIESCMSRLEGGEDFFESVEVQFKAGAKNFPLRATLADGDDGEEGKEGAPKLFFIFNGEKKTLGVQDFCGFVADEMEKYDAMVLVYNERGRRVSVTCDGKDVKLTNAEVRADSFSGGNVRSGAARISCDVCQVPGSGSGDSDNVFDSEFDAFGASSGGPVLGTGGSVLGNREYLIKAGSAAKLLQVIGIMGKNGKIRNDRIRKYNQIDHFVELIVPILESLAAKNGGAKPVRIIDCACGKSYLSFVLNYYIKEVMGRRCYFTGLDYNPVVIEGSRKMAEELGYRNMKFVQTDIMNYEPEEEFDLLLTLHACDTATDKALNFAVNHGITHIVCVPCCHREMNSGYNLPGFEPVLKYGILKARIADALTDGLRANYLEAMGYDVSVAEYISPLDTPKNLMIRAEKKTGVNPEALERFDKMVKSLSTHLSIGS